MRIAINISGFLLGDEKWNEMVETLFIQLASTLPQHQFVFIATISKQIAIASPNISTVVLTHSVKHFLGLKFWYDYKLATLLKKQKIDVFVNPDATLALKTTVAQILLINDLTFLQSTSNKKSYKLIKKRFQKSLVKAAEIVVFNPIAKGELLNTYPLAKEKISDSSFFVNPKYQPKEWQEKEAIKEKYSDGKEFFFYQLSDKNAIDTMVLLKAFSLFKKRQQSNMQLLLVERLSKSDQKLAEKMESYKYRSEVKILEKLPDNAILDVVSAAYCQLYFSNNGFGLSLLESMHLGVPAIVRANQQLYDMLVDTVLYAEAENIESIAEQMKIIYKDENLRSRMVAAAQEISRHHTVENTIAQLWPIILKQEESK